MVSKTGFFDTIIFNLQNQTFSYTLEIFSLIQFIYILLIITQFKYGNLKKTNNNSSYLFFINPPLSILLYMK